MIDVKELKIIACPMCGADKVTKSTYNPDDHGLHWITTYTCSKCGRSEQDYRWNTISKNEKIIIEKNEYIKILEKENQELKAQKTLSKESFT